MLREITYKNKDYIVVVTSLKIEEKEDIITVPVYMKVDVTTLSDQDRETVYRKVYLMFNRPINIKSKQKTENKKPWWSSIFSW